MPLWAWPLRSVLRGAASLSAQKAGTFLPRRSWAGVAPRTTQRCAPAPPARHHRLADESFPGFRAHGRGVSRLPPFFVRGARARSVGTALEVDAWCQRIIRAQGHPFVYVRSVSCVVAARPRGIGLAAVMRWPSGCVFASTFRRRRAMDAATLQRGGWVVHATRPLSPPLRSRRCPVSDGGLGGGARGCA